MGIVLVYSQREECKKNRKQFEISKDIFEDVTKTLDKYFSKYFKVIVSPIKERDKAYFLIKPNGDIFTPYNKDGKFGEIIIGNLFEKDILQKWEGSNIYENYIKKRIHFGQLT